MTPIGITCAMDDRLPPQALDAERSVLGSMLIDGRCIPLVLGLLRRDDFYFRGHTLLYDAITDVHRVEGEVDQITVGDYLKGTGNIVEAGGLVYLVELAAGVASAANVEHHCRIIKEKVIARRAIDDAAALQNALYDSDGLDSAAVVREYAAQIQSRSAAGLDIGVDMAEVMDSTRAQYEVAAEATRSGREYVGTDSGFWVFNHFLNGIMPSRLTVSGARPGSGKTTLAAEVAVHMAAQGKRVGFVSLEMGQADVGGLLARIRGDLDPEAFRKGTLQEDGLMRLNEADGELRGMPIKTFYQVPATIDTILGSMEHYEARAHVDFWVIDYLQRISMTKGDDAEIGAVCRAITDFKLRHNTHIWLLSQLSRKTEERPDHRPRIGDMRGSGFIEQEADALFLIHRPAIYEDIVRNIFKTKGHEGVANLQRLVEIIVAKNRFGPNGSEKKRMVWVPERAYFTEVSHTEQSNLPSARDFQ